MTARSSKKKEETKTKDVDTEDEDAEEEEEGSDDVESQVERSAASISRNEHLQEQLRQEEMTAKHLEERIAALKKANTEAD
jgi:hypothetical protein